MSREREYEDALKQIALLAHEHRASNERYATRDQPLVAMVKIRDMALSALDTKGESA